MDWCGQITWQIIPLPTSNLTLLCTVLCFLFLKIQISIQNHTICLQDVNESLQFIGNTFHIFNPHLGYHMQVFRRSIHLPVLVFGLYVKYVLFHDRFQIASSFICMHNSIQPKKKGWEVYMTTYSVYKYVSVLIKYRQCL